jgi:poly-gamma-glutamate synthase PgsB/CapB
MPSQRSSLATREPTASAVAAIVPLLQRALPPIQVRVRRKRLPALASRVARLADPRDFEGHGLSRVDEPLRLAILAALLVRAVTQLQVELAELDRRIAAHVDAYARARTPAARRERLEAMIAETASSARAARADRRALDRHLDLDALRERFDHQREQLVVLIELGIMAVGPTIALAVDPSSEPSDEVRSLIEQAEPVAFLLDQLALLRRWPSRLACVESLEAILHTLGLPDRPGGHRRESPHHNLAELREQLLTIARDRNDHEWVQARAIACLRIVDVERCRAVIRERLGLALREPPEWPVRDFLLRRLLVAQLCDHLDDPIDALLLAQAIARGEPSEFVRIAHAKALIPLARMRPESFSAWTRQLTRNPDDSREGERPRVHATACISAVMGLAEAMSTTGYPQLEPLARTVVESLRETIIRNRTPLVGRIACEQAAVFCEQLAKSEPELGLRELLPAYAVRLVAALHECLADEQRSAAIHDAAAASIEAIDEALRDERARWTALLRAAVDQVPPGGSRRIALPRCGEQRPNDGDLLRILAAITRNEWGLDVDTRATGLLVRRGDHRTTRMWRFLHELRHPAGNKRQAFRHTTGRRHVGRLRAHPSRLDEVTATVVPGERLHIDAEGGWGRHLPLVDDVLGLPWLRSNRDVLVTSSHGVTRLCVRGGLVRRLRARLRLNFEYPQLSELRRRALMADEPSERRRYADELRTRYGVELSFEAHPSVIEDRPIPARLRALFPPPSHSLPLALAAPNFGEGAQVWLRNNLHYFLTLEGNSQEALGLFALGLAGLFLGSGYSRRRKIAHARAAIPLSIGGWGTRGKSGTERLKAGLFHGLGFRTFSKTTGCEAMFIHAAPLGPQVEIFTFRPYGKATIWEQRELLQLAAGLESEVFLWECMALNPEYVDIMQRGWMRDDFATITNTYPDHEDIQGPAGIDVATVIGRFIPDGKLVISSELAFNPVLRTIARQRKAELLEIGDHDGDLLAEDLLALFPYSEHPRNIALVTELARQLGIDDELAIVTMADYVYPDLGVLKFYPEVAVRGRRLSFVNGCSANERAGFINNWKRTGCVELAAAGDPARMVMTVVNNRDDRVARSEVFSRILVNDVSVDAHVLIGTNLAGLSIFIDRALEVFAKEQELVDAEALAAGGPGHARARARLRALLGRVRAPVDDWWEQLSTLMRLGLAALGRRFDPDAPTSIAVREHLAGLRARPDSHDFDAVVSSVASDGALNSALRTLHDHAPEDPSLLHPHETGRKPDFDDFLTHLRDRMARAIVAARLSAQLEPVLESRDAAALKRFTETLTKTWIALFKAQIIVVWDAGATGDQIIDQCARAVPPGVHVTIMGTQNIKGTGLDFIYRWLALDAAVLGLRKLESNDEHTRLDALRSLDAHSDFGFTDTGMLVARLPEFTGGSAQEASLRKALLEKLTPIHEEKLRRLESSSGAAAKGGKFWRWIEGWIDFMDGAVRHRQSRQLVQDLIDFRVSHNKMAVEMREIYARAKGGWLSKAVAGALPRRRRRDPESS